MDEQSLHSYLQERLELLKAVETSADDAYEIEYELKESLSPYLSYDEIKEEIPAAMMVDIFELCAQNILNRAQLAAAKDNDNFYSPCYQLHSIIRVCPPQIAQSPVYQKIVNYADHLASKGSNTLSSGDTIDVEGEHIEHLPILLQEFATVSGQVVQGQHFKATPVALGDNFNSCVLISPKDSSPTLVIGRECIDFDKIEASLKALNFAS